ncbi:MAG: DUF2867 domain-containing protein [Pseudolysinimonas sp.]
MTAIWSIALRDIPAPDYAEATIVSIEPGGSMDPAAWARRIFSSSDMPFWVAAALGIRQALVPLLGVNRAPRDTFHIREHGDDEVLIAYDDRHLDFRCGVAVDEDARLLRVTTTVRLHGIRGRLYFVPVRLAHPIVLRAMVRAAARSWRSPAF